ncbi:MAG: HD domain-containing protein, partial [Lachnospiraceae bacterium]|nr:HD domain-containing protein [Lachnospiraceae bacterium]
VNLDLQDLRTFDNYTFAHSVNVAVYACNVGLGMNLNMDELEDLVLAALLHDLGKQEIPDEILNKPGRLTQEEFALIKTHPEMSYKIIQERLDISSMVKNAVLCHHENYDGSGYPNGLSGNAITLSARILHVVDVYDALVSKRTYKASYSPFAAIEILEGGKGSLYDPDVVEAFLKYVPIYPKGTEVELDGMVKGIVVENSGERNLRPIIRLENMKEIDLSDPKNSNMVITMPSDTDYFNVLCEEEKRKEMIKKLEKLSVMIIDEGDDTYANLSEKMSYLYNFTHVKSDYQAEGYIKKNGKPDVVIVDVDHRDLTNMDKLKKNNERMSSIVPVIAIGSYRDMETIKKFKNLGIRNYVLKPYRVIYLQSEIKRSVVAYTH